MRHRRAVSATTIAVILITGRIQPVRAAVAPATEVQGHVLRPERAEPTDDQIQRLKLPDGLTITKFAEGVGKPRMMVVGGDGTIYVSRRDPGDVLAIRDTNNDGKADRIETILKLPDAHGLAIREGKLFVATINELYVAQIKTDGAVGQAKLLLNDLPDAGQHPNRTIAFGPKDGKLYITVGSTCNACDEKNPEHATILRANPDGSERKVFARGLRNTIGFGWHPGSGEMWGMDHGIDWLGDDTPPEELNLITEDGNYGWPFLWGDNRPNPANDPAETRHMSYEQFAAQCTKPALTYTAHAAPLQMVFYTGAQFPREYVNDAFVAMHGSWNRKPPSGYEVVRIDFDERGKPVKFEPFLSGFLSDDGSRMIGGPAGLAVAKDGALLVSDDTCGVIWRIAYRSSPAGDR